MLPALFAVSSLIFQATAFGKSSPTVSFTEPAENPATAGEGHLQITWQGEGDIEIYELQQSFSSEFSKARTLYKGPDLSSFVSGLPSGETWYRVRAYGASGNSGPWSAPLVIRVSYPSINTVIVLMLGGIVMFCILVLSVLIGAKRSQAKGEASHA